MAEYIEREAAKLRIFEYGVRHRSNSSISSACENLERQMNSIPAADVRPVVLCRDCKYYFKDADGYEMCENSEGYDHVSEDGFCAWAARREES